MATNDNLSKAVAELKKYHPDDWAAHGIIAKAKTGYICPNPQCRNGSGRDGTGATAKAGGKGWQVLCPVCGDGYDIIDTLGFFFNLSTQTQFVDIVKRGCKMFGVDLETGTADNPPDYKPEEKKIDYERIKRTILNAQKNLGNFLAKYGNPYRGIYCATFEDFRCGYDPRWYARKDAPLTPRLIIPYSWKHYAARLLGKLDDFHVPDGVHLGEKEHSWSPKPIFNFNRLKASDDPICFIVEGELDCMSIAQVTAKPRQGNKTVYPINVIAIAGIKLSPLMEEQLKTLPQKNFIVMLDNDEAGNKAAPVLVAKLKSLGHRAINVTLSRTYNDANDYLQADHNDLKDTILGLYTDAKEYFACFPDEPTIPVESMPLTSNNPKGTNADKYAPLFEGLEPVRVSAGAILKVADSNIKTYLETLIVEKNFILFVNSIAPRDVQNATPDLVYSSLDAAETSNEQNEKALTWLVRNLAPFYHNDYNAMRRMIYKHLRAAQSQAGTSYFQDLNFIRKALDGVTVEPYDFEDKFKRELIAFADHSEEVFQSLIRFDYKRTADFLKKTLTDVTCAELLVDVQHDFLRFDIDQATWYWWDKNHWQAVIAKTNSHMYELWTPLARKSRVFAEYQHFKLTCEAEDFSICNVILDTTSPASDKKKRLDAAVKSAGAKVKEANKLESSRSIESYLEQASGLPEIKIHTNQLDKDDYLFNCANCTIDLREMETFPARREDLITLSTDTIYDPKATCPEWDNFVKQAIPDAELRDWLQRFIGYCMLGVTVEQIFVFVYGIGGSGKSTFLNAISAVFGDYAKAFPPELITENSKQKDGNEPNPILAGFRSARLIHSDETKKGKRLDEATMKRLTGADTITARELHKPNFEYKPHFKVIIDGNHALSINDVHDQSLRRRLRIVPFNNPPAPEDIDVMLSAKLSTPQARSAILWWCLAGCIKYQDRGLSDIPAAMQLAQDEFYNENDTISEFLEDCSCEIGDKTRAKYQVAVMAVWRQFNDWRKVNPHTPSYKKHEFVNAVLQTLKNDNVEVKDIGHQKHFVGFTINFAPDKDN